MLRIARYLTLCALIAGGCDSGGNIATVPVEGIVIYEGKLLDRGTVVFRPDVARGNTAIHEARGEVHNGGKYQLFTQVGNKSIPGAPPGRYLVAVIATADADEKPKVLPNGMPVPPQSLIPTAYADPARSGLSVEVAEQPAAGAYDLKLIRTKK